MASQDLGQLAEQLAAGFEALQDDYKKLFGEHKGLEKKLATAREQYNELAKLCDTGAIATPPLSLSSSPGANKGIATTPDITSILAERQNVASPDTASKVKAALVAAQRLRQRNTLAPPVGREGVRIWSGPAADVPEAACSMMPSISESPLEQDFTIEGMPSKLGCPFASMANKKLSSHAASVLSRYNTRDSMAGVPSTPMSSVSRVDGHDSFSKKGSRRASIVDPIKAEICGISDHNDSVHPAGDSKAKVEVAPPQVVPVENAEAGVCPIRFLDQHSPEEVATYFENHKHELPRSHEVCVRRYQSNEEQIRELDAKYGNLVSMISGLGAKHKEWLPEEPAEGQSDVAEAEQDKKSNEKVRKWASNVSVQAVDGQGQAVDLDEEQEERLPHFERPVRDIRVGESPSRPWGIPVPTKYLERKRSDTSSTPAQISSPAPEPLPREEQKEEEAPKAARKCPFGFDQAGAPPSRPQPDDHTAAQSKVEPAPPPKKPADTPAFISPEILQQTTVEGKDSQRTDRMVLTGPVFIGYSAEDAAKILRGMQG